MTTTSTSLKRHVQAAKLKAYFDELIDRHAEAYLEAYENEVREFNSFERCGTMGFYIGMVWTSDFGKPDTGELKIMGSRSMANNKIIEVDLSSVDSMQSFFPGQIVAFSADPFVRKQLVARKFLDPMRIAPKMKTINSDDKISLAIACGPFLKPDSVDLTILEKTLEAIKENNVTHAILIGPFVDSENETARAQFEACWKSIFDKITEDLHEHDCKVYLAASSRDILPCSLASNCFYPTQSIDYKCNVRAGVEVKCQIISVTDPEQIDLGGIYLDLTSAEVLLHLNKCTSFINKGQANTLTALYKHVLSQGIYPIYPAPMDFAADYVKLTKCVGLDRLGPHILVLPTRFAPSVSNIEDRLIVTVPRCATKRSIMLIEIPKIEETTNSLVITDFTHQEIQLDPKPSVSLSVTEQSSSPDRTVSGSLLVGNAEGNMVRVE